jgi:hypothetical protein
VLFGALCLGLVCGRVHGRLGDWGDGLEVVGGHVIAGLGDGCHLVATFRIVLNIGLYVSV